MTRAPANATKLKRKAPHQRSPGETDPAAEADPAADDSARARPRRASSPFIRGK
jgi:hypothetical protein